MGRIDFAHATKANVATNRPRRPRGGTGGGSRQGPGGTGWRADDIVNPECGEDPKMGGTGRVETETRHRKMRLLHGKHPNDLISDL